MAINLRISDLILYNLDENSQSSILANIPQDNSDNIFTFFMKIEDGMYS